MEQKERKIIENLVIELERVCLKYNISIASESKSIMEKLTCKNGNIKPEKKVKVAIKKDSDTAKKQADKKLKTFQFIQELFNKYIESGKKTEYKLIGYSKNDNENIWHYAFTYKNTDVTQVPNKAIEKVFNIVKLNKAEYDKKYNNLYKAGK